MYQKDIPIPDIHVFYNALSKSFPQRQKNRHFEVLPNGSPPICEAIGWDKEENSCSIELGNAFTQIFFSIYHSLPIKTEKGNGSIYKIQKQQSLGKSIPTFKKSLKVTNNEKKNRCPASFAQLQALASGSPKQMADLDTGQFPLVTDSMWTGTELVQPEPGNSLVIVNNFSYKT